MKILLLNIVWISFLLLALWNFSPTHAETPLEEYVWRDMPWDQYRYSVEGQYIVPGVTMVVLRMTSLWWKNGGVTNGRLWRHWVTVIIPDNLLVTDAALVRFSGGTRRDRPPNNVNFNEITERLYKFSYDTGAVSAEITNIPNQPIKYFDDPDNEYVENGLIAKSISLYVNGAYNDTDSLFLLPMIRAARRGIDTVIHFAAQVNPALQITKIMPTAYGKRGEIAFLLGGVDPRVFALAPGAQSQIKYRQFTEQHFQSYGGWSFPVMPYALEGIPALSLFHPRAQYLWEEAAIDPWKYFNRIRDLPILLTMGTGDEYFHIDATWNFWSDIRAKKYLRLVENAGLWTRGRHDSMWDNMATFFLLVLSDSGPEVSWQVSGTGNGTRYLTMHADQTPTDVKTWCANTTSRTVDVQADGTEIHRRDFRELLFGGMGADGVPSFIKNDLVWEAGYPTDLQNNTFGMSVEPPTSSGYSACYIEMSFETNNAINPNQQNLVVTSEVVIAPDDRPYATCGSFEECAMARIV